MVTEQMEDYARSQASERKKRYMFHFSDQRDGETFFTNSKEEALQKVVEYCGGKEILITPDPNQPNRVYYGYVNNMHRVSITDQSKPSAPAIPKYLLDSLD